MTPYKLLSFKSNWINDVRFWIKNTGIDPDIWLLDRSIDIKFVNLIKDIGIVWFKLFDLKFMEIRLVRYDIDEGIFPLILLNDKSIADKWDSNPIVDGIIPDNPRLDNFKSMIDPKEHWTPCQSSRHNPFA